MKKVLLTLASGFIGLVGFAQLSGTYTVNGAQATGGTNYQTFTAAFSALTSQGVNGPVVFNCVQGTYTEQVYSSSQTISGTSTTNTVTFQSASTNTNEVLWQYTTYPLYLYYPNNMSNVSFDGLHFKTTSTGNAIRIYYGTITNFTFENCKFTGYTGLGTSSTYSTIYMYYTAANNVTFENNQILNGDYAVYGYYLQASSVVNFIDNDILGFSYMGMYLYSGYYPKWVVKNNTIKDNPSGYAYTYMLYTYYWGAGSELSGNYLECNSSAGGYGIFGYYWTGTSSAPINCYNNIVNFANSNATAYQYAIYKGYDQYTRIRHNTIHVSTSYTSGYAVYLYYSSTSYAGCEFRNNIVQVDNAGEYTMYCYTIPGYYLMDNNVYSSNGGSDIYNYSAYSGTTAYNIGTWQTGTGWETNGIGAYPDFTSSTNLTPQNADINNIGAALGITTDYYGAARSATTPDPGAIEFSVPTNNAQPSDLLNPAAPLCDEDTSVVVVIKNAGLATLTSLNINYSLNAGTAAVTNWTGSLAPQAFDTVTIVPTTSFSNGDNVKVWTSLPNGVQDSAAAYDTIQVDLYDGMSGTYTIPGDFASITAARNAMVAAGLCDDVIFNVATGTYNEAVDFPAINGSSELATITFQSATANYNNVTITANGGATVNFNGVDWITFKNIKIENTSANPVQVNGQSDNVTIDHCWLKGTNGTSTNGQAIIYMAGNGNDFTVKDSKLEKGASWFYSTSGSTTAYKYGLTFENNYMKDQSYYGAYLYYFDGVEFNGNTIKNDSAFQYGYGYYAMGYWYYVNNFNVTKNYVSASTGSGWYYANYFYNCVGSSNPRSQISNNCITTGNETSSAAYYSLYLYNSGLIDIYNNSLNRYGANNSYGIYIYQGGAMNFVNNSVTSMGGGYASYINGGFAINTCDHNNYYTASGALLYFGSAQYNTLEDLQNATGQDMHSVTTNPDWEDLATCVTCNDTMGNAGTVLATLVDDINGNNRSVITPDIGAVEYVTPASFTLGADDTICGNSHIIEAGPAQSITWNVNNQTSTQPFVTLTANNEPVTFNISVNITTEYCGTGSDAAVIRLVPNANLDSTEHICAGATTVLEPGGSAAADFTWSNGANTPTITVGEAGTYSVTKLEDGCESDATIVVTQSDAVQIVDLDACSDALPVSIDATINNGTSYAWSGGSSINAAVNTFNDAGNYTVTATDSYGCSSTDGFQLTVLEAPEAAIVESHSGNAYFFDGTSSLYISANTTYLWDFGYNGLTATTATATVNYPWSDPNNLTTYNVTLTIDNGCDVDVKTMEVTPDPLGIGSIDAASFGLYPNPASDNVNIILGSAASTKGSVSVLDVTGRVIIVQTIAAGQTTGELNVAELAAGSYLVKVSVDGSTSVSTLIKK